MAALEPAVVRTTNLCIGMQFNFSTLLPSIAGGTVWPFKLHPVDPDGRRVAVAVFLFPLVVRIPQRFEVSVVGLFLLHRELANRIGGDLKGNLDRFRVLDGSGDLMSANGPAFESPVSALDLALRMSHLNETSLGRSAFNNPNSHAHEIAANGQFIRRNDDATCAVSKLQVSAAVAVWQADVVLVKSQASAP